LQVFVLDLEYPVEQSPPLVFHYSKHCWFCLWVRVTIGRIDAVTGNSHPSGN